MTDPESKTSTTIKETYELAKQLEEIKANIANLSSTVGRMANNESETRRSNKIRSWRWLSPLVLAF